MTCSRRDTPSRLTSTLVSGDESSSKALKTCDPSVHAMSISSVFSKSSIDDP